MRSTVPWILDSPPYIAASETAILAKHVDAVVLVVRWGLSGRDQVKDLIETLGKEKIIGTVFNAFEENELESLLGKKGQYGYKYNQYYHYHSNEWYIHLGYCLLLSFLLFGILVWVNF